MMELTEGPIRSKVLAMTIQLTPEDEKLIQEKLRSGAFRSVEEVIHRALVCLPTPETSSQPRAPRKNLADFLMESPFAGSELDLERQKDYPRPVDLS
jgi:Arc/MetJ-type ribon-helix-helix transcriptional regulator